MTAEVTFVKFSHNLQVSDRGEVLQTMCGTLDSTVTVTAISTSIHILFKTDGVFDTKKGFYMQWLSTAEPGMIYVQIYTLIPSKINCFM